MKNKKGSMELGINAIVVLIIALALLGLGIGFVTKLFTSSQSKMVKIIDRTDLPIHADSLNQIVFDTSTITVKGGTSEPLVVSIFNDAVGIGRTVAVINGECVDSSGGTYGGSSTIKVASPTQDIPPGTDVGFSVAVTAGEPGSPTPSGSYICTVHAPFSDDVGGYHDPSKQLFINVID